MKPLILALLLSLPLAGCKTETAEVAPASLSADAVGRYCGMNLTEHEGPKGQVILHAGMDPLWFSSARDTLAFTMLPDEPKDYAAIYVSDMGAAASWADPGADNWIDAKAAVYVTGSDAQGGMGGAELVPFASEEAARAFADLRGGELRRFADLRPEDVLDIAASDDAPIDDGGPHEH